MTRAVWIEAALNGPWTRRVQPGIPITVEDLVADGIACAKAGAAIIHVHAYDATKGVQCDDWEIYARIIEGIRARIDVPVYPTLPFPGSDPAPATLDANGRFRHTEELARRGLIEIAVVDPGSVNFSRLDEVATAKLGPLYLNPEDHVRRGLELARQFGFHPSYAIYEPGFTRLGAAFAAAMPDLPVPIYRFMFSTTFAWGFPPEPYALEAHLKLLAACHPGAPWMIAGLGVDIRPLIADAVPRGGHVRVGLEDAPFGTELSNVQWVEAAAQLVRAAGGEPATVAEVRVALAR